MRSRLYGGWGRENSLHFNFWIVAIVWVVTCGWALSCKKRTELWLLSSCFFHWTCQEASVVLSIHCLPFYEEIHVQNTLLTPKTQPWSCLQKRWSSLSLVSGRRRDAIALMPFLFPTSEAWNNVPRSFPWRQQTVKTPHPLPHIMPTMHGRSAVTSVCCGQLAYVESNVHTPSDNDVGLGW